MLILLNSILFNLHVLSLLALKMSGLNSSKNREANLKRRMNDDEQNGSCKKLKLIDVSECVLSI